MKILHWKGSDINMDKQYTLMHERKTSGMNSEHSEKLVQ
jgi:hypothetical protein